MITVTLEQYQIDFADKVAIQRREMAKKLGRKAKNGASNDEAIALAREILGTRTEAAGKVYLNPIKWHAFATESSVKNLPDLGTFIDVKGVDSPHKKLLLQYDSKPHWAYLLIDGYLHPTYHIVGWVWGDYGMQLKFIDDPVGGRSCYFVPRGYLSDPQKLFDIVRQIDKKMAALSHQQAS